MRVLKGVGVADEARGRRAGLGEQQQFALPDREVDERVQEGPQPVPGVGPRPQGGRALQHPGPEQLMLFVQQREDQPGAVAEAAIDRAHAHVGRPGHLVEESRSAAPAATRRAAAARIFCRLRAASARSAGAADMAVSIVRRCSSGVRGRCLRDGSLSA